MHALSTIDPSAKVGRPRALRPRDAATLILLDRRPSGVHVLMGRRHQRHIFMPGMFVFPGGRTDPDDRRMTAADDLHPVEQQRLVASGKLDESRARAIALSAIRETFEEVGLLIGARTDRKASTTGSWSGFTEHGVMPSLSGLRLVARAITPPKNVRRYDTRFFACWRDNVALELPDGGLSDELGELVWVPIEQAKSLDIADITGFVLADLQARLVDDPDLAPGGPANFYRTRRNRLVRDSV